MASILMECGHRTTALQVISLCPAESERNKEEKLPLGDASSFCQFVACCFGILILLFVGFAKVCLLNKKRRLPEWICRNVYLSAFSFLNFPCPR